MSTGHKALIQRYAEIWNTANLAIADEIISPRFTGSFPGLMEFQGVDGFKERFTTMHTAFPDGQYTLEEMITEGDTVVVRWTIRGTHTGQFDTLEPTGKQVEWSAIVIYRIAEGKIVAMRGEVDNLSLMQQLGVIPA